MSELKAISVNSSNEELDDVVQNSLMVSRTCPIEILHDVSAKCGTVAVEGTPQDCLDFVEKLSGETLQTVLRLAMVGANLSIVDLLKTAKNVRSN